MINLQNKSTMGLNGDAIEYPIEFGQLRLDDKIETFNLGSVMSLNVIDSIDNDKDRKKADYEQRRNANVVTGMVSGGLIDGLLGDGDTIIDGAILGAGAGYLFTDSDGVAKAKIAIAFKCGRSLSLEVDSEELSLIVARVQALLASNAGLGQSFDSERALTNDEIEEVMSRRVELTKSHYVIGVLKPFLAALMLFFMLKTLGFISVSDGFTVNFYSVDGDFATGDLSNLLTSVSMFSMNLILGASLVFVSLSLLAGFGGVFRSWVGIRNLPKLPEWQAKGFRDEQEYTRAIELKLMPEAK